MRGHVLLDVTLVVIWLRKNTTKLNGVVVAWLQFYMYLIETGRKFGVGDMLKNFEEIAFKREVKWEIWNQFYAKLELYNSKIHSQFNISMVVFYKDVKPEDLGPVIPKTRPFSCQPLDNVLVCIDLPVEQ